MSSNLNAQYGFNDSEILELLERNTERTGLPVSQAIDEVMEAISSDNFARVMITVEGEILFQNQHGQYFLIVGITPAGDRPKPIVCRASAKALRVRSVGISAYSKLIAVKDILEDNFTFVLPAHPQNALEDVLTNFPCGEPAHKSIKRNPRSSPAQTLPETAQNFACQIKM